MKVIILAGGKGKRLHSDTTGIPKALQQISGKSLLSYLLETVDFIQPEDICIVIGFQGQKIRAALGEGYTYAIQTERLGTGHWLVPCIGFSILTPIEARSEAMVSIQPQL